MSQHNLKDWHLLADRFAFYSEQNALSLIPEEVSNEEIQRYLYTYHGDDITVEEINKLRLDRIKQD